MEKVLTLKGDKRNLAKGINSRKGRKKSTEVFGVYDRKGGPRTRLWSSSCILSDTNFFIAVAEGWLSYNL